MEEATVITCAFCKSNINPDEDWYEIGRDENTYCDQCHSADINEGSTLLLFTPGEEEPTKVLVGSWFIVDGENYEEWTTPKITSYWKATNAHRGHTETSVEGYTEILSGWTTGMPDETVRRKALFNDWVQKTLQHTPVPVALACETTSNVFSTGIGISVPTEQVDEFKAWLGEDQFKELHDWLG